MIINTELELEIGKIYTEKDFYHYGFNFPDGGWETKYTFQVLRKASREEHDKYNESIGFKTPQNEDLTGKNIYLLSLD